MPGAWLRGLLPRPSLPGVLSSSLGVTLVSACGPSSMVSRIRTPPRERWNFPGNFAPERYGHDVLVGRNEIRAVRREEGRPFGPCYGRWVISARCPQRKRAESLAPFRGSMTAILDLGTVMVPASLALGCDAAVWAGGTAAADGCSYCVVVRAIRRLSAPSSSTTTVVMSSTDAFPRPTLSHAVSPLR